MTVRSLGPHLFPRVPPPSLRRQVFLARRRFVLGTRGACLLRTDRCSRRSRPFPSAPRFSLVGATPPRGLRGADERARGWARGSGWAGGEWGGVRPGRGLCGVDGGGGEGTGGCGRGWAGVGGRAGSRLRVSCARCSSRRVASRRELQGAGATGSLARCLAATANGRDRHVVLGARAARRCRPPACQLCGTRGPSVAARRGVGRCGEGQWAGEGEQRGGEGGGGGIRGARVVSVARRCSAWRGFDEALAFRFLSEVALCMLFIPFPL